MTDHNREERAALIEEAAKAIYAARPAHDGRTWDALEDHEWEAHRYKARAALAVFEQAHTPTSDERDESLEEALAYLDTLNADRQIWYDDYRNLHDLVSSATRHPEVPEPQAEPTAAEGTGQPTNQTATGSPSGGPEPLEGT